MGRVALTLPLFVQVTGSDMATLTLNAQDALVPRIAAAMRGTYPTQTSGIAGDGAAIKACILAWVRETVATWEASQSVGTQTDFVNKMQTQYNAQYSSTDTTIKGGIS